MRLRTLMALSTLVAVWATGMAVAPGCTQETLSVRGTPVTIGYCVSGAPRSTDGDELIVPIVASYGAPGGSFSRSSEMHFVAGEGVSRVIESLDLSRLGMTGTLHLTLAYSEGRIRIEGALLTPGAITVK
ncbi:MAG: hypothetical protein JO302_03900 [Candidatus Eremiobacteraeota bacterium]|nr:hypothetical protein [Candidatus Eremiobacteraeota bacterium]